MKKLFMTLIASMLLLSSTTYAVEMSNSHAPKQMMTMSKADTQKMLSEAGIDASRVSVLDKGEMVKTEGQYGWWGALAGAAYGAYGYIGHSLGSGHFSVSQLGVYTAGGAAAGIVSPTPTALAFIHRSHALMFGGAVGGYLGR